MERGMRELGEREGEGGMERGMREWGGGRMEEIIQVRNLCIIIAAIVINNFHSVISSLLETHLKYFAVCVL